MDRMNRLFVLLGCCGALWAADLTEVHAVYVMPMTRGMDQYLANRLTNDHLFQVVTDPKLADAIFTDRIGENFQTQLENFFPAPKPPEEKKDEKKDAKSDDTAAASNPMLGETVNKLDNPALASTFGRGKGTIFLVDAKSRQVVWSTFDPQGNIEPRPGPHCLRHCKPPQERSEPEEEVTGQVTISGGRPAWPRFCRTNSRYPSTSRPVIAAISQLASTSAPRARRHRRGRSRIFEQLQHALGEARGRRRPARRTRRPRAPALRRRSWSKPPECRRRTPPAA